MEEDALGRLVLACLECVVGQQHIRLGTVFGLGVTAQRGPVGYGGFHVSQGDVAGGSVAEGLDHHVGP